LPEHVVWFGAHDPWQVPPMHVWFVHAVPAVHWPALLHVSGWFMLEQLSWLGAHTPAQAPDTHVVLTQATAEPYVPLAWQVSTPLPEHVVSFGAHDP
jgi:hypothetical protein